MTQTSKPIHAARYQLPKKGLRYLVLREVDPTRFSWFERQPDQTERDTEVFGTNIEEAMREAYRSFKDCAFRFVHCGFRYTLPERDEHGINALLREMIASYSSMNGVYFDNDVGHNCYVQAASDEAIELWKSL